METLGDLVRGLEGDGTALRTGGGRAYDRRRFATTAMKAGNFLRLHGGARGALVGIADVPAPESLFAFFGAALLGARVRFGSSVPADADLLVAPTANLAATSVPSGAARVGFGDPPDDPSIAHFERGLWSENPAFPPTDVPDADPVLLAGERSCAHRDLLDAAASVVESAGLGAGDAVALREPLSGVGAVVAGVIAPPRRGGDDRSRPRRRRRRRRNHRRRPGTADDRSRRRPARRQRLMASLREGRPWSRRSIGWR